MPGTVKTSTGKHKKEQADDDATVAHLTNNDLDALFLGALTRAVVVNARSPEHETERGCVSGIMQIHLRRLHFAVEHYPHLIIQSTREREAVIGEDVI